jgi:hypothetical protein
MSTRTRIKVGFLELKVMTRNAVSMNSFYGIDFEREKADHDLINSMR